MSRSENKAVTDYWLEHYVNRHMCSLCGNSGRIDTRGVRTAAGHEVGRINFCICPNGQALREHGHIPGHFVRVVKGARDG